MAAEILIVDDDQMVRDMISLALKTAGYAVRQADNGETALRSVEDKLPDLVILDIVMPEKEGLETLREIHSLHSELKVIAISGGGVGEAGNYLTLAKKFGAAATMRKPISLDDLTGTIKRLLA